MNLNLKPIHDMKSQAQPAAKLNPAIDVLTAAIAPATGHVFKLGLDVDLHFVVTAVQCDHGAIKSAHQWTRAQSLAWVQQQVKAGHTVHTVYAACGFGYTLHEQLAAAGAHSLKKPMTLTVLTRDVA